LLISVLRSLEIVLRVVVIPLTPVEIVLAVPWRVLTVDDRLLIAEPSEPSELLRPDSVPVTFERLVCNPLTAVDMVPTWVDMLPTWDDTEPTALETLCTLLETPPIADDTLETCAELASQLLTVNELVFEVLKPDVLLLTVAPTRYTPSDAEAGTVRVNV